MGDDNGRLVKGSRKSCRRVTKKKVQNVEGVKKIITEEKDCEGQKIKSKETSSAVKRMENVDNVRVKWWTLDMSSLPDHFCTTLHSPRVWRMYFNAPIRVYKATRQLKSKNVRRRWESAERFSCNRNISYIVHFIESNFE